jgi:glycosyltransferase involved in cell wall biosynthesis
MKVTAFTRYDRQAASTRQRLLQYLPALAAAGIEVRYEPLLGDDYVRTIVSGASFSRRNVARAYLGRLRELLFRPAPDVVWIYAELFPFLPGWVEKLALSRSRAVVCDFDDAFFHNYDASPNAAVRTLLGRKLQPLLKRAAACCCGNAYLEEYASRFCPRTIILPTVVDSEVYRPRPGDSRSDRDLVIGWIGSPTTWRYMRPLLPVLTELAAERGVKVRVVGAGPAAEADRFPGLELVEWTESGEVADVQDMDIGVMPVADEFWALGKSGYKLIQYMACGLPVVASPVGVNRDIVSHRVSGFHATSLEEWRNCLGTLIDDAGLRSRMGSAGRKRVEEEYSLQVHAPRLAALLQSVAQG